MHPLIGRLWQSVLTIFTAITVGFVLIQQLPTGPWQVIQALYEPEQIRNMEPERIKQISESLLGFDAQAPMYQQYIDYWISIMTLDLGTSTIFGRPVADVLLPALPWTVLLSAIAMVLNIGIGISLGAYMAYREGSRFDVGATFVSVILSSTPYYVLALLLLIFVGYQTGLFPSGGRYPQGVERGFNPDFILGVLHHAILPALSLVFVSFAALGLRAHSIRILGSDYIRVARLRGLPERRIVFHYVLRNSVLPFYTGFVLGLVGLFGGSIITEQIFSYIGIGYYTFRAAAGGDIPLVLGTFAIFTIATVVMLFVVDLTYIFIDPRAEGVGASESF